MSLKKRHPPQKHQGYRFSDGGLGGKSPVEAGVIIASQNVIPIAVMVGAVYLFMNRKK